MCIRDSLRSRVDQTLAWLVEDGATVSDALIALVTGLEAEGVAFLVVDMVEQGLDSSTQQAMVAHLRRRMADRRPLFLLTRSSAFLDLAAVGADEAIILCPANHSPPTWVAPYPGAPGYEAVATCLAAPEYGPGQRVSSLGALSVGKVSKARLYRVRLQSATTGRSSVLQNSAKMRGPNECRVQHAEFRPAQPQDSNR